METDLKNSQIDIEKEIIEAMASQITAEIDAYVMRMLLGTEPNIESRSPFTRKK